MDIKLIDGKWKAVFQNDTDEFFNLTDVQRKLFGILIGCEFILVKHNIKLENKILSNTEKLKLELKKLYLFKNTCQEYFLKFTAKKFK